MCRGILTTLVAFILFGFTFSSCKACKDEKGGDDDTNKGIILDNDVPNPSDPTSPDSTPITILTPATIEQIQYEAEKAEEAAQIARALSVEVAQAAEKVRIEAMALPQKVADAKLAELTFIYVKCDHQKITSKEVAMVEEFWRNKILSDIMESTGQKNEVVPKCWQAHLRQQQESTGQKNEVVPKNFKLCLCMIPDGREAAKEKRALMDAGVVATIVNAKAVWAAGKLVAQATDEATKAGNEAIRAGATDAQGARAKVAQAQALEANKKTQELALKTEVTVACAVMEWALLRVRMEDYAVKDEAEQVNEMVERVGKMRVLTVDSAREATRGAVMVAVKMCGNARLAGSSSFEDKEGEIEEVVRVLIDAHVETGNLTQAEVAKLKALVGI